MTCKYVFYEYNCTINNKMNQVLTLLKTFYVYSSYFSKKKCKQKRKNILQIEIIDASLL